MKRGRSLRLQNMHIGGHIVLIVVAAIILIPLYYVFVNAFKSNMGINLEPMGFSVKYFTMDNLGNAWRLLHFPRSLLNSVILVVLSCAMLIVSGALAGFAIALVGSRLLRSLYTMLVLLISVPFQVILIPIIQVDPHV